MKIALAAALSLLAVPCLAAAPKRHETPKAAPSAEPACAPLAAVIQGLAGKYHEAPRWAGKPMHGPGALLVTQSEDGSTWTLLRLQPGDHGDVLACVLAAGTDARSAPFDAPAASAAPAPPPPADPPKDAPAPDDEHIHGSTDGWRKV